MCLEGKPVPCELHVPVGGRLRPLEVLRKPREPGAVRQFLPRLDEKLAGAPRVLDLAHRRLFSQRKLVLDLLCKVRCAHHGEVGVSRQRGVHTFAKSARASTMCLTNSLICSGVSPRMRAALS